MPRTNKHANKLPANLPQTLRCLPVFVPDDPEWLAIFQGHIHRLTDWSRYDKESGKDREDYVKLWREATYGSLVDAILAGEICQGQQPDESECTTLNAFHPAITYHWNHPVYQPGYSPLPYGQPAWITGGGVTVGTTNQDAILNPLALFGFADIGSLLAVGAPSFTLHFSGIGEVDLEFIQQVQGGAVWLFPDGNPLQGDLVDLEWFDITDLASIEAVFGFIEELFQGDQTNTTIHTMKFATPGNHTITGWFIPKGDLEPPFAGWGGGLRTVQLCGETMEAIEMFPVYSLSCDAGTINLHADGAIVDSVDLEECGVMGPQGPAGQDGAQGLQGPAGPQGPAGEVGNLTLERISGSPILTLLNDGTPIDTVTLPGYSINRPTDSQTLTLRIDGDDLDTATLPAFTIVRPYGTPNFHLVRDGLTSVASAALPLIRAYFDACNQLAIQQYDSPGENVSTVVTDIADWLATCITGGVMYENAVWSEVYWDFTLTSGSVFWKLPGGVGWGYWNDGTGYHTDWQAGNEQRLRMLASSALQGRINWERVKITIDRNPEATIDGPFDVWVYFTRSGHADRIQIAHWQLAASYAGGTLESDIHIDGVSPNDTANALEIEIIAPQTTDVDPTLIVTSVNLAFAGFTPWYAAYVATGFAVHNATPARTFTLP